MEIDIITLTDSEIDAAIDLAEVEGMPIIFVCPDLGDLD